MRIIIAGASGQISEFLLPMLLEQGHELYAISRTARRDKQIHWLQYDLNDATTVRLPQADLLINAGSLSFLPGLEPQLVASGVRRLIAFSSTSIFTKSESSDLREKSMIFGLIQCEKEMVAMCERQGIGWTLFRPTLIYSLGRDKNLTLVDKQICRFRCFPLIGSGRGMRQPVHASDLAKACVQALETGATVNHAYNLSGGEVLSYRDMVARLFERRGLPVRMIPVPVLLLRALIMLLRMIPRYRYLSPNMADRMQKDMLFSHDEASRDFGYSPKSFLSDSERVTERDG